MAKPKGLDDIRIEIDVPELEVAGQKISALADAFSKLASAAKEARGIVSSTERAIVTTADKLGRSIANIEKLFDRLNALQNKVANAFGAGSAGAQGSGFLDDLTAKMQSLSTAASSAQTALSSLISSLSRGGRSFGGTARDVERLAQALERAAQGATSLTGGLTGAVTVAQTTAAGPGGGGQTPLGTLANRVRTIGQQIGSKIRLGGSGGPGSQGGGGGGGPFIPGGGGPSRGGGPNDFVIAASDAIATMAALLSPNRVSLSSTDIQTLQRILGPNAQQVLQKMGVTGQPVGPQVVGALTQRLRDALTKAGVKIPNNLQNIDVVTLTSITQDLYSQIASRMRSVSDREERIMLQQLANMLDNLALQAALATGKLDIYPGQLKTVRKMGEVFGPDVASATYTAAQLSNTLRAQVQAEQAAARSASPFLFEERIQSMPGRYAYIRAQGAAKARAADEIAKAEAEAEAMRKVRSGEVKLSPGDMSRALRILYETGDIDIFTKVVDALSKKTQEREEFSKYAQGIKEEREAERNFRRLQAKAEDERKAYQAIIQGSPLTIRDEMTLAEAERLLGGKKAEELKKLREGLIENAQQREQALYKVRGRSFLRRAEEQLIQQTARGMAIRDYEALVAAKSLGQPLAVEIGGEKFELTPKLAENLTTDIIPTIARFREIEMRAGPEKAKELASKYFAGALSSLEATAAERESVFKELERQRLVRAGQRAALEIEIATQALRNIRLGRTPIKSLELEKKAVLVERASPNEPLVGKMFREQAAAYEKELTHFRRLKISWEELLRYMGRVFIGLQAFDLLRQAINVATNITFGFARQMQDVRIGLVGSITALNRYTAGRSTAQFGMREQVRLAAAETSGTILLMKQYALKYGVPLDQLLEGYQTAAGVAKQAGFTGPNVVKAVSALVTFSQAMNISMSTLARTIDNVFSGQRAAQVTLGRMLGLTEKQVREMVAKGTFRGELMRRLEPITEAVRELGDTSIRVQFARTTSAMMVYFSQLTQPLLDMFARGIGVVGKPFTALANEMILQEALFPERGLLARAGSYLGHAALPLGGMVGSFFLARALTHAMRNAALDAAQTVPAGVGGRGVISKLLASALGGAAGGAASGAAQGFLRRGLGRIAGFSLTGAIASRPLLALLSGLATAGGVIVPELLLTALFTGGTLALSYGITKLFGTDEDELLLAAQIAANPKARDAIISGKGMKAARRELGLLPISIPPTPIPNYRLTPTPTVTPSATPTPEFARGGRTSPSVSPTPTPTPPPLGSYGSYALAAPAREEEVEKPSALVERVAKLFTEARKTQEALEKFKTDYIDQIEKGVSVPADIMRTIYKNLSKGHKELAAINVLIDELNKRGDETSRATAQQLEEFANNLAGTLSKFTDTLGDAERLIQLQTQAAQAKAEAARTYGQLLMTEVEHLARRGYEVSPGAIRSAITTSVMADLPALEMEAKKLRESLPEKLLDLSKNITLEDIKKIVEAQERAQGSPNLGDAYIENKALALLAQREQYVSVQRQIEARRSLAAMNAEQRVLELGIGRQRQFLAYTGETERSMAQFAGDMISAIVGIPRPDAIPGGIQALRQRIFRLARERFESESTFIDTQYQARLLEAELMPGLGEQIRAAAEAFRQSAETQSRLAFMSFVGGIPGTQAEAGVRRITGALSLEQARSRLLTSQLVLASPLSEAAGIRAKIIGSEMTRAAIQEAIGGMEQQLKEFDETAKQAERIIRSVASTQEERIHAEAELQKAYEKRRDVEKQLIELIAEGNERLAEEIQQRMELYRRSFAGSILSGLVSGGPFAMFQALGQRGEQTLNVAFARLLGYIPGPRRGGQEQRVEAEKVQVNVSGGAGKYSLGGQLMDDFKKLFSQTIEESKNTGGAEKQVAQDAKSLGKKIAEKLGIPVSNEVTDSLSSTFQVFRVISGTIETVGEVQDRIRALRNQVGWTLNPDKYAQRAIAEVLRPLGLGGFGKIAGMSNFGKGLSAAGTVAVGAGIGALVGGPVGAAIGAGLGALFGAFGASGFGLFKPPTPPSRLRRGLQRVFDELGIPRDARGGRGISFMPTEYSEITGEVGAATGLYLRKRYPGLGDLGLLPIRMIYATAQAGKALGLAREDTEYLARSVSKKLVPSLEAAAMALASLYRKGAIGQKDFLSGAAGIARIFGELPPAINASALAVNAFARDGSISFERLKRTIQDAQQVVSRGIADAVRLGVESGGSIALTGQEIGDAFSDAFLQRVTERLMQRKDIGDALTRAVTEAESAAELLAEGRTQEYAVQIQKVMSLIAESQTKVAQIISPVTQALYSVRTTLGIGAPGVYAQIGFGAYNAQYIANQPARYLYKDTGESPAAYAPRAFRTEDIEKMGQVISGAVATAIERSGSNQKVVLNIDGGEFGTAVSGVMYKQSKTRGIQVSTPQMVGLE